MPDVVTSASRSRMMSGIRSTNTKPELLLRKGLHARGFRFRIHSKDLPGKPDIVLKRYRALVLVHGCLWHQHECHLFKWPCKDNPTKARFWRDKITSNKQRDGRQVAALREADWRVAIVWECALKGKKKMGYDQLIDELTAWIESSDPALEIAGL